MTLCIEAAGGGWPLAFGILSVMVSSCSSQGARLSNHAIWRLPDRRTAIAYEPSDCAAYNLVGANIV